LVRDRCRSTVEGHTTTPPMSPLPRSHASHRVLPGYTAGWCSPWFR
jgi:hypothetical protein